MCNYSVFKFTNFLKEVFQRHKELHNLGWCTDFHVHAVDETIKFEFNNKMPKRNDKNGIFSCYYCSFSLIFKRNNKNGFKKNKEKEKALRFGFIIRDALDYKTDENARKVIDCISSVSLVKALESVTGQHYGCNCYYCKLYNVIIEKLLERKHTYLIAPETLDYKEKEPPFPFYDNWHRYR